MIAVLPFSLSIHAPFSLSTAQRAASATAGSPSSTNPAATPVSRRSAGPAIAALLLSTAAGPAATIAAGCDVHGTRA